MNSLQLDLRGTSVAIDGQTLRRSFDAAAGREALHLVSAWAGELRVSLGQWAVDDKSNEIPAVRKLLELLDLEGAVVTVDAMHCQKETAQSIRNITFTGSGGYLRVATPVPEPAGPVLAAIAMLGVLGRRRHY